MSVSPTRRIQTNRGGRLEPLIPRPPLLSSASGANWQGLILEKHMAEAEYVRSDFEVHWHLLHMFTGVPVVHEWRADGHHHRVRSIAGDILIEPQGLHASVHVSRSQPEAQWLLEFDPTALERRLLESTNLKHFELTPQFDVRDPQVLRMMHALQADVEAGSPAGSMFGEMIGASLALYLANTYSSTSARDSRRPSGLTWPRLQRVLEYIQANLDSDIHLDELATVAGLSAFHFAKLFKQSTGSTPHQYILQRRIDRAKELLQSPEIGLSEISLRAGFADQSHLTNVFRRFVGVTPLKFRSLL